VSVSADPLQEVRPWQRLALAGVFSKAVADRLPTALVVGGLMGLMGLVLGPMFGPMQDSIGRLMALLPEGFTSFFGGADMATPSGFLNGEMYSMMAPAAVILVAVVSAGKALAGELEAGSMGLLAINPLSRRRIATDKAAAMLIHVAIAALLTGLGVWIGILLGGLPIDAVNVLAVSLHLGLLGAATGALALLLSVVLGRRVASMLLAAAVAFVAYVVAAFLPLSASLEGLVSLSPWYHYNGSDPLSNGVAWFSAAILALLTGLLLVAAVWRFERRDLAA
jgi:ABC-2 type transport system permease protein